jgi:hypothetical protein
MSTIKRGTTPTHIFTIPIDSSEIANCAVIYWRRRFEILEAIDEYATGFPAFSGGEVIE